MKVLIISGTGWLGSHISNECAKAGHDLTVVGYGTIPRDSFPAGVKILEVDRSNHETFRKFLDGIDTDIVIDVIPGYFGNESTQVIIDSFRGRIKRFIQCGSTGVYTPLSYLPGDENHVCNPVLENGEAFLRKNSADNVLLEAVKEGFPGTVLRPTCMFGPGNLPLDNIGTRNPNFLRDIMAEKTIEVPGDGEILMQPLHIIDMARAFVCCIEHADTADSVYNISSYKAITFNRYLEIIRECLGKKGGVEHVPFDELYERHAHETERGDYNFLCRHMCFDITKARTELGYEPTFTAETALADNLKWAINAI